MLSTVKFPIAPRWNPVGSPHLLCLVSVGFQCPPVLKPSLEEQSPNSWIWIAFTPGSRPNRCASRWTESFFCVNETVPDIFELFYGLIVFLITITESFLFWHAVKENNIEMTKYFMIFIFIFANYITIL